MRKGPLRIITLFIIAFTAALLYSLPLYLETVISDNLDFGRIKENLALSIKEKTGLTARIQGARFDLINGIILFGIRLYPAAEISEQTYLIQIESLAIEPSYLNFFRGGPPFKKIRIERGRINVDLLNYPSWLELLRKASFSEARPEITTGDFLHTFLHPEETLHNFDSLQIEATDLSAAFIRTKSGPNLVIDLAGGRSGDGWRSEATVYLGDEARTALFHVIGSYNPVRRGILFFKMEGLDPSILHSLLALSPFLPEDFANPPAIFDGGLITGMGSLSFYGQGIGININADYENLRVRVMEPLPSFMTIAGSGHLSINSGIETETGRLVFNRVRIEQPELLLDVQHSISEAKGRKGQSGKGRINDLTVNGRIDFPEGRNDVPALSFADIFGEFAFSYRSTRESNAPSLTPHGKLTLSNLRIYPPRDLRSGDSGEQPPLITGRGTVELGNNLSLSFSGDFMNSRLSLHGRSPIRISRVQRYGREPEYQLEQKWDLNAEASGLSYGDLFAFLSRIHRTVLTQGSHPDAKKIEDSGPVWENGFMNRPLYQNWLRLLNLAGEIKLSHLKNGGDLPSELRFRVNKTGGTMAIQLNPPSPSLDFVYRLELERQIPQHELRFNLSTTDNPLSLRTLTGIGSNPRTVEMVYVFGGEGIYTGDLVGRTWSSMSLKLGDVDLKDFEPAKILMHRMDRSNLNLFAQTLTITRSTEGPFIKYGSIQIQTPDLSAYGSGDFSYYRGGNLNLNLTLFPSDPPKSVRQHQRLAINGDGTYSPF